MPTVSFQAKAGVVEYDPRTGKTYQAGQERPYTADVPENANPQTIITIYGPNGQAAYRTSYQNLLSEYAQQTTGTNVPSQGLAFQASQALTQQFQPGVTVEQAAEQRLSEMQAEARAGSAPSSSQAFQIAFAQAKKEGRDVQFIQEAVKQGVIPYGSQVYSGRGQGLEVYGYQAPEYTYTEVTQPQSKKNPITGQPEYISPIVSSEGRMVQSNQEYLQNLFSPLPSKALMPEQYFSQKGQRLEQKIIGSQQSTLEKPFISESEYNTLNVEARSFGGEVQQYNTQQELAYTQQEIKRMNEYSKQQKLDVGAGPFGVIGGLATMALEPVRFVGGESFAALSRKTRMFEPETPQKQKEIQSAREIGRMTGEMSFVMGGGIKAFALTIPASKTYEEAGIKTAFLVGFWGIGKGLQKFFVPKKLAGKPFVSEESTAIVKITGDKENIFNLTQKTTGNITYEYELTPFQKVKQFLGSKPTQKIVELPFEAEMEIPFTKQTLSQATITEIAGAKISQLPESVRDISQYYQSQQIFGEGQIKYFFGGKTYTEPIGINLFSYPSKAIKATEITGSREFFGLDMPKMNQFVLFNPNQDLIKMGLPGTSYFSQGEKIVRINFAPEEQFAWLPQIQKQFFGTTAGENASFISTIGGKKYFGDVTSVYTSESTAFTLPTLKNIFGKAEVYGSFKTPETIGTFSENQVFYGLKEIPKSAIEGIGIEKQAGGGKTLGNWAKGFKQSMVQVQQQEMLTKFPSIPTTLAAPEIVSTGEKTVSLAQTQTIKTVSYALPAASASIVSEKQWLKQMDKLAKGITLPQGTAYSIGVSTQGKNIYSEFEKTYSQETNKGIFGTTTNITKNWQPTMPTAKTSLTPGFGIAQMQKQFSQELKKQSQGNLENTLTGIGVSSATVTSQKQSQEQMQKQLQAQNQMQKQMQSQSQQQKQTQLQRQAQRQMQSQFQGQTQMQKMFQGQVTGFNFAQLPSIPKIPIIKIPRIPLTFFGEKQPIKQFGISLGTGFQAEVKRFGKWFKLGTGPLTKQQALQFGASYAAGTAGRSFKIGAFNPKMPIIKQPKGLGLADMQQFYVGKQGQFVEKTAYAINLPGEFKEISAAGRAAPRKKKRKRSWFF